MEIDFTPWLNMAIRWLHVITGIAWIGSSFYFVWLDNHLEKPKDPKKGMSGELWSVHGGGFYHNQKYAVAPEALPDNLHWFKWEAYFTWMSGFALMALIYYWGADLFLIDKAKMALNQFEAIAISLAFILGSWVFYDTLCKSALGSKNKLLGILWFGYLTAVAYGLTHIFNDRAAYVHIGVIVGSVMAFNVFMVIIPNQKKVVAALLKGEAPDPALGIKGKQRSLHNNYMTLPVLLMMVSNHYPMTFSNPYNWVILAGLALVGVLIRHYFNVRHKAGTGLALPISAAILFVALIIFAATMEARKRADYADVGASFAEVQAIVGKHCTACHAAVPTHESFDEAPAGLKLDSREMILLKAPLILEQAVNADIMPLGNETGMTDKERAILGQWIKDNTGK